MGPAPLLQILQTLQENMAQDGGEKSAWCYRGKLSYLMPEIGGKKKWKKKKKKHAILSLPLCRDYIQQGASLQFD